MQFNSPKNFKRGRLISNRYRIIDVVIAGIGIMISIFSIVAYLLLVKTVEPIAVGFLVLPFIAGCLMLIPYDVYHNLLVMIELFIIYKKQNKKYIWEGVYKHDLWEKEID